MAKNTKLARKSGNLTTALVVIAIALAVVVAGVAVVTYQGNTASAHRSIVGD